MNAIPFVIAAYAVTGAGIGGLLLYCWYSMRRDERALDLMRRGR